MNGALDPVQFMASKLSLKLAVLNTSGLPISKIVVGRQYSAALRSAVTVLASDPALSISEKLLRQSHLDLGRRILATCSSNAVFPNTVIPRDSPYSAVEYGAETSKNSSSPSTNTSSSPNVSRRPSRGPSISASFPLEMALETGVEIGKDRKIAQINARSRGQRSVTDVLSQPFDMPVFQRHLIKTRSPHVPFGDTFIAGPFVLRQCRDQGISFYSHLPKLLIHSVFHILGFDHERSDEEDLFSSEMEAAALSRFADWPDVSDSEYRAKLKIAEAKLAELPLPAAEDYVPPPYTKATDEREIREFKQQVLETGQIPTPPPINKKKKVKQQQQQQQQQQPRKH